MTSEHGKQSGHTLFYAGVIADMLVVGNFLLVQPGLSLISKGDKWTDHNAVSQQIKYSPLYLELPVNIVINMKVGPGKAFIGAGPYLSARVGGKFSTINSDQTIEKAIKYGKNNKFGRFDYGLNFLLGYQLANRLSFNGNYSLSEGDIASKGGIFKDVILKNRVLSFGVGYHF